LKPISILVIEGDKNLGRLFSDIFRFHQWDSVSVSDRKSAIEAIQSAESYQIIFTSYRVAGTNGIEMIKLIRAVEHRRETPVILLTGSGGIEEEAYAAGATEVVAKPIGMYGLTEIVKRHTGA
jgi:DNA-binding NtrC family response regulator